MFWLKQKKQTFAKTIKTKHYNNYENASLGRVCGLVLRLIFWIIFVVPIVPALPICTWHTARRLVPCMYSLDNATLGSSVSCNCSLPAHIKDIWLLRQNLRMFLPHLLPSQQLRRSHQRSGHRLGRHLELAGLLVSVRSLVLLLGNGGKFFCKNHIRRLCNLHPLKVYILSSRHRLRSLMLHIKVHVGHVELTTV